MTFDIDPRLAALYQTAANFHRSGLKPHALGHVSTMCRLCWERVRRQFPQSEYGWAKVNVCPESPRFQASSSTFISLIMRRLTSMR